MIYSIPPPGCILELETDYVNNTLTYKRTANYQECADYSATTPGALFWTWSNYANYCYLRSSNVGKRAYWRGTSGNNKCGKKTVLTDVYICYSFIPCNPYAMSYNSVQCHNNKTLILYNNTQDHAVSWFCRVSCTNAQLHN